MPTYSRIIGAGSHLPAKVLTNHDLTQMVETSDQWIRERTGIEERHVVQGTETTCDLAEVAARQMKEFGGMVSIKIENSED